MQKSAYSSMQYTCLTEMWGDEPCPGKITSVLLSSHQKKVTVREWLGRTTAVMFTSLFFMTTKGARSRTCSTGPEEATHRGADIMHGHFQRGTLESRLCIQIGTKTSGHILHLSSCEAKCILR